jgi:hypothetical protein
MPEAEFPRLDASYDYKLALGSPAGSGVVGLGYGGSCFPKDVAAFISISEQIGEP